MWEVVIDEKCKESPGWTIGLEYLNESKLVCSFNPSDDCPKRVVIGKTVLLEKHLLRSLTSSGQGLYLQPGYAHTHHFAFQ